MPAPDGIGPLEDHECSLSTPVFSSIPLMASLRWMWGNGGFDRYSIDAATVSSPICSSGIFHMPTQSSMSWMKTQNFLWQRLTWLLHRLTWV